MSSVSSINSSSASSNSSSSSATLPQQTLSQNDFLQLLVTQMTQQDPLNPESDTDLAAQMAQFTALSETSTMSNNISTMLAQQQMTAADGMIGQNVTIQVNASSTTSGVVQSVQVNGGTPQIVVNGTPYNLSQVLTITPATTSASN